MSKKTKTAPALTIAKKAKRPVTDWLQGQKFTVDQLVVMVKDHAVRMYNWDGWDFLVETVEDEELRESIKTCKTFAGACETASRQFGLKLANEQRQSVMNEAF